MNDNIKLEIPNDPLVLRATAKYLLDLSAGRNDVQEIPEENLKADVPERAKPETVTPPPPPPPPPVQASQTQVISGNDTEATVTITPPPQPPVGNVELDAEGLPWDERIHTDKKTKLKRELTWKLKRGIDKEYVEQIKAELRLDYPCPVTQQDIPTETASPVPTQIASVSNPAPPPPAQAQAPTVITPPPAPAPAPPVQTVVEDEVEAASPPPPTNGSQLTWPQITDLVVQLHKSGKLSQEGLLDEQMQQHFGVSTYADMVEHKDQWDELHAFLTAWIKV